METAVFAGGCFWCLEAVFQRVKGVNKVTSGYAGGQLTNPTYEQVGGGRSGHAEVVKLEYNPDEISFQTLLEIFFTIHDPTTLNRQGNDVGTQYRSAIFYTSNMQRQQASQYIQKLTEEGEYVDPIVTQVGPLEAFYSAEDYHQDYYNQNQQQPYCQLVISPKIQKFEKKFAKLLKEE
ncbi:MAG: peptide-methionine (S)-S-oxide reductase MsrA [Candidatus Doudnabacteria bacterium]|nr:peptide-methionine (S)-S-oxide reductase MsrA [Candidatus Doudnabacteria bacterium]